MRLQSQKSNSGNLREALSGINNPDLLIMISNKSQFEQHVKELAEAYPNVPSIATTGHFYDSQVKEGVAELIEWITLDTTEDGLQYKWANGTLYGENGTKDAVASAAVMKKSDGKVALLGNQNMFDVFVPANANANGKTLTQYDEDINSIWRDQVRMYTSGQKTKEEAMDAFKQKVKDELDIDSAE